MRGKDFNTGLRGVLFESRHYERMGQAVWLYGWLVLRQTRQVGTKGLVLGGRPVSYHEIAEETGFQPRTLESWMRRLRREGYIETRATTAGVVVQITKAKKFVLPPDDARAGARRSAGTARTSAETLPLFGGGASAERQESSPVASGISSGYVDERERPAPPYLSKQNSAGEEERHELRTVQPIVVPRVPSDEERDTRIAFAGQQARQTRLLRAEAREELVRRELQVGAGPEIRRPNR